jgi:hypothetical protein
MEFIIAYLIAVSIAFGSILFASTLGCKASLKNHHCQECGLFDPEGKIIKSLVGIKYWVCNEHFPENKISIRSRIFP